MRNLALKFKEKIESLYNAFPTAGEKTMYLMAGLMLIDEIGDATNISSSPQFDIKSSDIEVSKILDEVTKKVEDLIQKLENTCDVS